MILASIIEVRWLRKCRKYDKDGTLQKSFSAKAAVGQKRHGGGKKESYNSFAQVMDASRNSRKRSKRATKAPERRNVATNTATRVIPTQNRIVGTVVL